MFNSQALEIGIGLAFVFLTASLLAMTVRELIEAGLKTRAIQLERGIRQLLDDPDGTGPTSAVFSHPQVFSLFEGVYDPSQLTRFFRRWRKVATGQVGQIKEVNAMRLPFGSTLPSYIPSRNFALALLDLLAADGGKQRPDASNLIATLHANALALRPGRLRDALLTALTEADGDFDRARTSIEAWFDATMDRVSGWYKRENQVILFVIGLITAIAFNIDAIGITHTLTNNNSVRAQLLVNAAGLQQEPIVHKDDANGQSGKVAAAGGRPALEAPSIGLTAEEMQAAKADLGDLVGWKHPIGSSYELLLAMVGWIITGAAISLGAPFWFDTLNKLMVIRATVKPFEKSAAEGSDDRSAGKPAADRLEPANAPASPPAAGDGATGLVFRGETAPWGHVLLAIGMDGLSDVALTVDGKPVPVPLDGEIELPLSFGDAHILAATAKNRWGVAVAWTRTIRMALADDYFPIEAELA